MALLDTVLGTGRENKIEYEEPQKDPVQKEFEGAQFERAMNPRDVGAGYDKAIQHGKGLIQANTNPEQGLWSQALAEKSNQRFNRVADQLKRRSSYDQSMDNNKILGIALKTSMAQRELDRSIQMRKAEAEANYQAERARAIGAVLGTAGMVGGAALGGAPGAMAGGQVGNLAGGGASYDSRAMDNVGTRNRGMA